VFVAIPAPTDAQRAAAAHKDNPAPLPPFVDHATAAQIAELGPLFACGRCGYRTRISATAQERADAESEAAAAGGARSPARGRRA
jgi:hypothetical protein